jgi:hypothetical protein
VPPGQVLTLDTRPVFFDDLIVVAGVSEHGTFLSPHVMDCIDHLAAQVRPDPPAMLYVSRRERGVRCFDNEAEQIAMLAARGARIIDPGSLSLDQQIAAFRAAPCIVGVMGAGMTNIAFAPRGARVLTCAPASMPDTFFWFLATLRRQVYAEIRCEPSGPSRGTAAWDTDIHLPPAELAAVIDALHGPPRPRIVAVAVVCNEQDIIEPFIRHTLSLVDRMLVVDAGSVDETGTILAALAAELPRLTVHSDPTPAGRRPDRLARLVQDARTLRPDWIMPLRAEEFLRPDESVSLLDILAAIPPGGIGLLPVQRFVLTPQDARASDADPPRRIRARLAEAPPRAHRAVLRLDGARPHRFVPPATGSPVFPEPRGAVPAIPLDRLVVQCFPVRGRAQIIGRAITTWMHLLAGDPAGRQDAHGRYWRAVYARVAAPGGLSDEALCAVSRGDDRDETVTWVAGAPPDSYIRTLSSGAPLDAAELVRRELARMQD